MLDPEAVDAHATVNAESTPGNVDSRVVLAHDYLTQMGGAERVALEVAKLYRPRLLVTSVYEVESTYAEFARLPMLLSPLQRFAVFRSDPRRALPFLPLIWSGFRPVHAELLICSSSGWSHGLRAAKSTKKVVYCHNPARWIYQPEEHLGGQGALSRAALIFLRPLLRAWDKRAAESADLYIANSSVVRDRIAEVYGVTAKVINPPVSLDPFGEQSAIDGLAPGFFVTVARHRAYKGTDSLIEAFRMAREERLVIVGNHDGTRLPANVNVAGRVSDAELRWLYSNARALVSVSQEDFGLTPLEANSLGTPSLVVRAGGFLDSTAEGVSGLFIEDPSPDEIARAVVEFPRSWDRDAIAGHAAGFSPDAFRAKLNQLLESHIGFEPNRDDPSFGEPT